SLATNLIDHQPHLPRRDADKFCDRACFHNFDGLLFTFSFPEISLNHFASPESLPFRCRRCWRCRGRWSWGSGCGSARWCGCSDSFLGLRLRSPEWAKKVLVGANSPSL